MDPNSLGMLVIVFVASGCILSFLAVDPPTRRAMCWTVMLASIVLVVCWMVVPKWTLPLP